MFEARTSLSSLSERVLDLLYPRKCGLCGLLGEAAICAVCFDAFERIAQPMTCYNHADTLDYQVALFRYEGRAAQAVRRLKYDRITSLASPLGAILAEAIKGLALDSADLIVPVPIHWSRRCMRGFNQSEMLVDSLEPNMIDSSALARIKATRPQVGLSAEQRRTNLIGAFRAASVVRGARVLLVDDVVTSGQTARECARALKKQGALEVGVVALCGEV